MLEWVEVTGLVASTAVLCLTVYKILSMRKTASSEDIKTLRSRVDTLEHSYVQHQLEDDQAHADIAVLKTQVENVKEDMERVEEHCEKSQDLLIRLLTEDK